MKIALDIHGVLSDWELMTPIVHELIAEGHELYVVSGAPKRELEKEIVELGYQVEWFKGVYSIIDWLLDNNAPGKIWHNEKGWWYDNDVRWWKTKAEIAEFYGIDILLDDQEKYKQGYLKPGTFTLYSTFKSFKGWKDPSSFLLKIASYYRPAPPWKLVAKEDIPVKKLEPPTGRIFYVDFKFTAAERKELTQEEKERSALIEQLHRETLCGMTKAYNYLSYSKWDIERARTYARNPKLLEEEVKAEQLKDKEYHKMQQVYEANLVTKVTLDKEQKDPAESSVVQMRLTINKNRGNKMAKILYLAVDMQKDFMDQDGALYVTGSEEIKSNIKKLATKMDKIATHKFYTMDWHEEDDSELSDNPDFINTFPPHCIAGTRGAWLIPQAIGEDMYLDEDDFMDGRTLVFYKNEFSVFKGNPDFLDSMNAYAYFDKIYIAGVSGDVCVKYVLEGLLEHKGKELEFETLYIVEDCIASLNKEAFDSYLTDLILQYDFIKIIKGDSI